MSASSKTARKIAKEIGEKALKLYLDYLSYPTQEDVARELKVSQYAISSWLSNIANMKFNICYKPPESLQITTTWDFPQCDKEYGIED